MKTRLLTLAGASAFAMMLAGAPANASTIVLTFEGIGDQAPIGNYYAGGGGPNYGITFGSDALAIISGAAGGGGNFSGSPTMPTIAFFLGGAGDIMNVPAGFTTGFSFYYSAVVYPGVVTVYDGLDATGSVLASINLPVTPIGGSPECTYGSYCPWVPIGVAFSGTAKSVNFSGVANYIGFDNITLGSETPGSGEVGVPEPLSMSLFGAGMLALGFARRRRARA